MKRTLLSGLFVTAAILASPAFAADDLCGANLQRIDDTMTTEAANNPAMEKGMQESIDKAKQQKASGDEQGCVATTTKILTDLEKTTNKSGGANN